MKIYINGKAEDIQDGITMQELLGKIELGEKRIAVELNQEILPRSSFSSHIINENDEIEIVNAIGGG